MVNIGSASSPRTGIAKNEGHTYEIAGLCITRYSTATVVQPAPRSFRRRIERGANTDNKVQRKVLTPRPTV